MKPEVGTGVQTHISAFSFRSEVKVRNRKHKITISEDFYTYVCEFTVIYV